MPRKKTVEEVPQEFPAAEEPIIQVPEVVTDDPPDVLAEHAEEPPPEEEQIAPKKRKRATQKAKPAEENAVEPESVSEASESPAAVQSRDAFYDLDFHELDRGLSPEEQGEWNSIYASYRSHSIMAGTVVGIDQHRLRMRDKTTGEIAYQRAYCAIVIPFRVRILIPEGEMWIPDEERPTYVLRNMPGAKIEFVIVHVDREGGFAIASRRVAMLLRRRSFARQLHLHREGVRLDCRMLAVGPRRCLVTCQGYDVNMTQRELSYAAIPDLRDVYHAGQVLPCVVKSYDRPGDDLEISVKETVPNPFDGAEFRHPPYCHRQAVISGKYGGGVFCNLPDGVTVMCSYSFYYDDASFRIGDRVILIIQRYDQAKKQVYGKIVGRC